MCTNDCGLVSLVWISNGSAMRNERYSVAVRGYKVTVNVTHKYDRNVYV